ncbi:MAG TPA: tetratricopeptide repeat protein, partial [Kofleriaceae bacterium]|nr:tetratricopeptide repeat protein [Kofleriaceae bacterium]
DHSGPGLVPSNLREPSAASSSGHIPISTPEVIDPAQTFEPADFDAEGVRTILTAPAYELRPRFTGRTRAIEQLQELTLKAFDRRGSGFAVVIGEPGMGRSRMINELAARVRVEHPTTRLFQGVADENAHAYGPVARALTVRFGIVPGEDPAVSRDKLAAELADVIDSERLTEVAHLIAHLLRVPYEDSPIVAPIAGSPQRLEARLFMALKRFLAAESERYPLVVVIENLELCGADTINFVHYLAAGLRDHRVVIIGTATPDLMTRHPGFGEGDVTPARIELGALTPAESEELLRELCSPLDDVPAILTAHVRTMNGSPRTILELIRLLLETSCIFREDHRWRIDHRALAMTALPRAYDDLVAARLKVLDPMERRVLEMAASVGDTSWFDAILALERHSQLGADPDGPTLAQIAGSDDQSRQAVVTAVGRLVDHGWLIEVAQSSIAGERELRFASGNLWSILYDGLPDATRRGYHAVVARWLELHPEGLSPSAQEEVAGHLVLAGAGREAALRYRRAAEAARASYANQRAIQLFDRALDSLGAHDLAIRIQLWRDLASVYELIGDFEAALGAFERMLRLSWVAASKATAAEAFNKMGRVWRRKGDLKLALEYLQRGLELFRGANDTRGLAGSLDDIGRALHMMGRYGEAEAQITEALARHTKDGDQRAIATSLSRLGNVHQDRGHYEAAHECHRDALAIRKATGDRWGQIVAQNNLAALSFELGELSEARAGWLGALPEAEAIGALPLCALILTNLGEAALAESKLDEARSRLENALEIIENIEDRGLESVCCRHLAALDKLQGNAVAARELSERALAVAQKAGLREHEAQAYMTLGDVLSASIHDEEMTETGALAPAAVAFGAAVEVLANLGNEAALAKALFVFGRYKAEMGDHADAKDMLRDALMMFSRLGLERRSSEVERLLASMN